MTAEKQNDRLGALYQAAFPKSAPSDDLRRRLLEMASQAEAAAPALSIMRTRRTRRMRIGFALAASSVAALGFFVLKPMIAGAAIYDRMQRAISDVHSAHIVSYWRQLDGTFKEDDQTWYDARSWRIERYHGGRSVEIVDASGTDWSYSPDADTVEVRHHLNEPRYMDMSGFSLAALKNDAERQGFRLNLRLIGDLTVDGRPAHQIEVSGFEPGNRSFVTVDSETDLPIKAEAQDLEGGRWVNRGELKYEFNQPVNSAIFKPDFPKSARFLDMDVQKAVWRDRLAKGIAERSFGETHIAYAPLVYQGKTLYYQGRIERSMQPVPGPLQVAIRDLEVNDDGDVFVLYTTDQDANLYAFADGVRLSDNLGTQYMLAGGTAAMDGKAGQEGVAAFMPTCIERNGTVNGFVYNGDMLEGAWFIPVVRQHPWKPRKMTITIDDYYQTFAKPTGEQSTPGVPESVSFTLPLTRSECQDVPAYMQFMARPDPITGDSPFLLRTRYYMNRQDWSKALTACNDLLAYYQGQDEKGLNQTFECNGWYMQYEILEKLGRTDEARKALLKARDTMVYDIDKSEINAALKKEGLG